MKFTRKTTGLITTAGLLLILAFPAWAQEDMELTPLQQKLYELRFGIFTQEIEAPDFSAPLLNGQKVKLSDYRGQVVLLNLWATWCPPCRAEMPSMQTLYEDLGDEGFTILAVSAPSPPRETEEKIRAHVAENEFTFPVLIDTEYQAYGIYNTGSIPTSYLIDTDGKLVARLTGAIEWNTPGILGVLREMLQTN
jgi:peroxiredoxin